MANIGFDHYNKYILHDETDTDIDIIEVYSKSKDEEDFPHIAMTTGIITTATGKDNLGGGKFTGVTVVLRNGWKFKCRTIPASPIKIKISNGNTIAESGNPLFENVDKVHYEFDQSTSPALISTGGITPTQAQIRESMTLATGATVQAGSIDGKLNLIDTNVDTINTDLGTVQSNLTELLSLVGNDQEWVSPGLLKIYDSNGKTGGVTLAEFETRTSAGVQTFVFGDVKQFIRTK